MDEKHKPQEPPAEKAIVAEEQIEDLEAPAETQEDVLGGCTVVVTAAAPSAAR